MWTTVIAAFFVLAVFLVLWIVFFKKRQENRDESDVITYTCNECGEKNCNCYREDEHSSDV